MDNGWNKKSDCIEVIFSVKEDTKSKHVSLKVYLYDKNGEKLHCIKKPSHISYSPEETETIPVNLEAGDRYTVYFAIPKEFSEKDLKWRRCVAVLSYGDKTTATVYPKDVLGNFDFAEKSKILD